MSARQVLVLAFAAVVLAGCLTDAPQPAALVGVDGGEPTSAAVALGAFAREPVLHETVAALRDALLLEGAVEVEAEPAYLLPGVDPRDAGAVPVKLELARSALVDAATWAEIDGERVTLPFVETYEGHVAGDPSSPARLTIAEGWARGTVRIDDVTYRVRVNMDGNFPLDAAWDLVEEDAATRAALLSPDWTFDKDGTEPRDCLSLVPQPLTPVLPGGAYAGAPEQADLVLDSDHAFGQVFHVHTFPLLVAFLNEVDEIYAHEVGVRFRVVGVHAHTDPAALPDPANETPLTALSEYWNARPDVDRDVVHLVTGLPSTYAQANCIGGAGMPDIGYTFSTVHWGKESYGKTRDIQTYAHELGHIFNAHHHYGNALEAAPGTTIMHQGGQKVHPVFSTLTRTVIRGWAEANLG